MMVNPMSARLNEYRQPIGPALPDWNGARRPGVPVLVGRHARLERVDPDRHAAQLHEAYRDAPDGRDWTYMSAGPFESLEAYRTYLASLQGSQDPMHYAVIDSETDRAVGTLALMRIDPSNGVIEVGSVAYSRRMQRTRLATDVMAILLRHVFVELGYRRFEWKCDALNAPSRAAALRYGFTFEGVFRQAVVTRGRNRDTAWYSVIDREYPVLGAAYLQWLDPENFSLDGRQIRPLAEFITGANRAQTDRP
jgi:RimJ/RimL family protein N-acetyltransferase